MAGGSGVGAVLPNPAYRTSRRHRCAAPRAGTSARPLALGRPRPGARRPNATSRSSARARSVPDTRRSDGHSRLLTVHPDAGQPGQREVAGEPETTLKAAGRAARSAAYEPDERGSQGTVPGSPTWALAQPLERSGEVVNDRLACTAAPEWSAGMPNATPGVRTLPEPPGRPPRAGRSCRRGISQSRARPTAASLRFTPGRPWTASFPGKISACREDGRRSEL